MIQTKLLIYSTNVKLEHSIEKCGPCLKLKIKQDVALEFSQKDGKLSLADFFKEVKARWEVTHIYKEVQGMLNKGMTMDEIAKVMNKKGILI